MKISQEDVLQFKHRYSDENRIIADIIGERLSGHFEETIVDVGAGMGDITSLALPSKKVVQIDILDYTDYVASERHRRLVVDFFDYAPDPSEDVRTLFFSHVLQFIDRDVARLNEKVRSLSPNKVIIVTNVNDGFMRGLLDWAASNFEHSNPEVDLPDFPLGYKLSDEVMFEGHVVCADYHALGKQVEYLLDSNPSSTEKRALESFLRENLEAPTLSINQKIKVYDRV